MSRGEAAYIWVVFMGDRAYPLKDIRLPISYLQAHAQSFGERPGFHESNNQGAQQYMENESQRFKV